MNPIVMPEIAADQKIEHQGKTGRFRVFWKKLAQIYSLSQRSYVSLLIEFLPLKFGAGRLSLEEYAALRLYDGSIYRDTDKTKFAGFKTAQKIWLKANYRFDFYGIVNNKILSDIMFGTYGFPIMPTIAIYREGVGRLSPFMLHNKSELENFLRNPVHYPLFGKPISEHQSHGTASLESYDSANNRLITTTKHGIFLNDFITYVSAHSASGYIFQKRVSPHAEIRKICGDRLATLRLLTIISNGEPKLLRACWKIPAAHNIADNFWRPGNLLAQLDYDTGRVMRVIRGSKAGFEEVTHHPDTGTPLLGIVIPHWHESVRLAIEGAKVIEELGLIGWDIAPIDSGAVIVEVNETPDFKLHQLADKRGILDSTFTAFLSERKSHAAHWLQKARQKRRVVTELIPPSSHP